MNRTAASRLSGYPDVAEVVKTFGSAFGVPTEAISQLLSQSIVVFGCEYRLRELKNGGQVVDNDS